MKLLKSCAATLSLMLLLQTFCDLWCHEADKEEAPLSASVTATAPTCHDAPVQSDNNKSKPARNDRSCMDCDHLIKIAEDNSARQTIVKEKPQVASRDFPSMEVRLQFHPLPADAVNNDLSDGSPPSSLILRI